METKYVTPATLARNLKSGKWLLVSPAIEGKQDAIIELTETVQVKTRTRRAGDRYYINTTLFAKKL